MARRFRGRSQTKFGTVRVDPDLGVPISVIRVDVGSSRAITHNHHRLPFSILVSILSFLGFSFVLIFVPTPYDH
jgi:hypothetical protein